jgi:hypothetical protein|nr:MAG TPA: hypothetical protein [Crassvirales sp.]
MIKFKHLRTNEVIKYDKLDYLPRIGECVNLYNTPNSIVGVVIKIVHERISSTYCVTIEVY